MHPIIYRTVYGLNRKVYYNSLNNIHRLFSEYTGLAGTHLVGNKKKKNDSSLVKDYFITIHMHDYQLKKHTMKGLIGQTLTQVSTVNGFQDILTDAAKGGGEAPVQIVHSETSVEDVYGCGCTSELPHVVVGKDWFSKIPPPLWDEEEMLERLDTFDPGSRRPTSRIGSEIVLTKELDGLEFFVPDLVELDIP